MTAWDWTILGVVLALVAVCIAFVWMLFRELERRLERELTWLEALALAVCMPYSALVLFLVPERAQSGNGE